MLVSNKSNKNEINIYTYITLSYLIENLFCFTGSKLGSEWQNRQKQATEGRPMCIRKILMIPCLKQWRCCRKSG